MKIYKKIQRIRAIMLLLAIYILFSITGNVVLAKNHTSNDYADKNMSMDTAESLYSFLSLSFEALLTSEERDYILKNSVIKAATVDGAAPLSFTDENGEIQGIFQRVLDRISQISGLTFECRIYNSVNETLNSDADIIYGISPQYATDKILLSQPFLETETVLYMNSSVKPDQLDDKIFGAVKGSRLLEGIREENTVYFDTREDSLNAVERGKADYGYGNAYSVSYYTLLNGYKDIVTVPIGKETREYCIGVLSDDEVLLSIINKSLSLIDAKQMHTLILDVASHIDRKITLDAVFDNYGTEILITALIVLSILLFSVFSNIRVSNKLREQNRKYEVLSQISNEYLYEYFVKEKHLKLYDKFNELFNTQESIEEVVTILKNSFSNHNNDWLDNIIRLPLPDGKVGIFKVINTNIYDVKGRTECIIGKLIDVSAEVAEKEELLIKSQIDELTGLNNAATTKELIIERIELKQDHVTDAFILIDCDNFKEINDTHGHLVGNQVLEHIAMMMKQTYRKTDILGRVGGDEFCIYMKEIPSVTFVQKKSQKLSDLIRTTIDKMSFSISMGIVLICKKEPYEVIFKKADTALYQAKRKGKAQSIIYCEHEK